MSSLPCADRMSALMRALCLPTEGKTQQQLYDALAAHLVGLMLGQPVNTSKRPADTEPPREKKKKRATSAWVKFLASERVVVKQEMPHLTAHREIMREIARRWAIKKVSSSSSAPLLLTYEDGMIDDDSDATTDELTLTLTKLPPEAVQGGPTCDEEVEGIAIPLFKCFRCGYEYDGNAQCPCSDEEEHGHE